MKKSSKAFIILGLILVCILAGYGYVSGIYNNLVSQEESVEAAWSDVQNQYQRRLDLIPSLTLTVKRVALQEADAFKALTDARKAASAKVNISNSIIKKISGRVSLSIEEFVIVILFKMLYYFIV